MKYPKTPCNLCGVKVRDCNQAKWNHVWKFHPDVPLFRLMGLFLNPAIIERVGEMVGLRVRAALKW